MAGSPAAHIRLPADCAEMALAFEPPGRVLGRFPPGSDAPASVNAFCNGRYWVRVPVSPDAAGATFALDLPTVREPRSFDIEVQDAHATPLGRIAATALPRLNGHGLDAWSVREIYDLPLFSVPWLSFDGARLVVSGSHLPPAGDPGLLSVRFAPGVAFDFAYPLPSPEFANHFWYWPNAGLSNFLLTIDLPASRPGSDPFAFEFVYPIDRPGPGATPTMYRLGRNVCIPPRLDSAICFPRDAAQLTRVQTWSNDQSVTFTGYAAFRTIEALLARYGVQDGAGVRVLDWGCGHGRVVRHLLRHWTNASVAGADIDRENVAWCRQNLGGDFAVLPLLPPTALPDASFDGLFGISVMTHLTAEVQDAWLKEIARVLKPGGIALLTFAGFAAAAFSSVFRTPEWWRAFVATGFDDAQHDPALDGRIDDAAYYRNTLQSPRYTLGAWSRHLEILDIHPSAIGYQDVAVLRRRRAEPGRHP